MQAEVTAAAAETSNRRRLMFNGKSGLAMMPSLQTKAWRNPLRFAVLSAISPLPGDRRACGSRLVRAPALVLMQEMKMGRGLKQIKDYPRLPNIAKSLLWGFTSGRRVHRTALPQELVCLVPFKELAPWPLFGLLRHQKGLALHVIIVAAILKILFEPPPNLKAPGIADCDIPEVK